MNIQLDEFLQETNQKVLKSNRRCLKFLTSAYNAANPGMIARPRADITANHGGFSFHYGCPDPEMRTIASWLLTQYEQRPRKLAKLIPALWKRHGREDLKLVGLLLANLSVEDIGEDPWIALIHLFGKQEPLEIILEIAEEMNRSGHDVPSDEWLIEMAKQSVLWHQIAMLFVSVRGECNDEIRPLVLTAPGGGELFEKIRSRLLTQSN
tara:strand:- start:2256 stop:2882 length:627 start_codon:yes stop_codon:yes gene_type:complete